LLVFGGAVGRAGSIRRWCRRSPSLRTHLAGAGILHQTGVAELDDVRRGYETAQVTADVRAFIDDMGSAYGRAALVVSRAGAMSCAEITARGLPAILVPYPHAADDHQRFNAAAVVDAGAADMILDAALDGPTLLRAVTGLLGDPSRLARMAAASRTVGRPDAAARPWHVGTAATAGLEDTQRLR
jgi:UDP-N-acetylglucosamine--N-acetylmuramyl-(pentapeptide) pyrophosphoryl-undecaprenol N-acetylglucosamine transferase